jgi:formylmethanofuran dehydrogenase subunit B
MNTSSGKLKPTPLEEALKKSAQLLRDSKRPILLGWSNSTTEAITLGLKIAQHIAGVFESTANFEYGGLLEWGLQGGDSEAVSLEMVRDSADHIIYWGVNPAESHHRHASRYTVFPKGKNIPEGRESRIISVIDIRDTESMRLANHQLILSPSTGDVEFLKLLIAELEGTREQLPERIGGVPAIEFLSFSKQLRDADNIALFYGNGLLHSAHASQSLPLLAKLSTLLNRKQNRCWTLPMIAYCNTIGAVKASLKVTNFPFAINFGSKPAKSDPSVFSDLKKSIYDCVLIAGWDALSLLPRPIAKALADLPIIALSTHPTLTTQKAIVVFPTALTGAETAGTVHRMDGTVVPLQPFRDPPKGILTEEALLSQLLEKLS